MEDPEMAAMASLSVAEIRSRLLSLETERQIVQKKRELESQRLQWIETRQQQQARLRQLIPTPSHEPAASPEPQARDAEAEGSAVVKAMQSKRELMEELREQTLQVLKKQKEVASKISDQLRSLRQSERPAPVESGSGSASVKAAAASPSASPPKSSPTGVPARRSNKLVLVPSSTRVLGKRRAPQSSPSATSTPSVHYPPLVQAEDVGWETPAQLASLAFRAATRHFLQNGTKCSLAQLKELLETCTNKQHTEDEVQALVKCHPQTLQLVLDGYEPDTTDATHTTSLMMPPLTTLTESEIQLLVDTEKLTLDEMVTSWTNASTNPPRPLRLVGAVNAIHASSVFGTRSHEMATSLEALLADCLGANRQRDEVETAFPHLSRVWSALTRHFDNHSGSENTNQPSSSLGASSKTFGRPFDLEQSVMKQIKQSKRRRRSERADPMKVLCMYELSGMCNDANCPYQHQRDFEEQEGSSDSIDRQTENEGQNEDLLMPRATRIALNQFMQLREDLRKWWPSPKIIFEGIEPVVAPPQDTTQPRREKGASKKHTQVGNKDDEDVLAANQDFLELGSSSSEGSDDDDEDEQRSGRYCMETATSEDAEDAFSDLQQHVATKPEDVDAWLLLALRCLRLEISWSDDQARLSNTVLLLGELEAFYSLVHSSPSNAHVQIQEENVAKSLHVLSRALEIESNAYCEELWMTHLRLSQLLTEARDMNAEQETTEQALGFLPHSVSLWRHLLQLQLPNLDSLDEAVMMYHGQLQIIATASLQATQRDITDAFSVLLCDVVIQLCALYCSAGRSDKALSFLRSLVTRKEGEDEETTRWQKSVRARVIGDDLLILYGLQVHIALFADVPLWLRERAFRDSDTINAYRLLLPVLKDAAFACSSYWREARDVCETAFDEFGDPEFVPPGLEVVRHNWVVIVTNDPGIAAAVKLEQLTKFVDVARKWTTLLPRVWTALATSFEDSFDRPDVANQLIEELMSKYKENASTRYERFGEALHHYLIHRPQLFCAPGGLIRTQFPNVPFLISRLTAMLPACDPVYSRRAFKRILQDTDPVAQQKALRNAFHGLLRDTLDFVVKSQLSGGAHEVYDEQDSAQDTYYLLAQVQLMGQVCGPQDAIDALELYVIQGGFSKWSVLTRECRRLIWSTRFLLQCELLKLQPSDANPSRELFSLLQRYCTDIGLEEDTGRDVKRLLQECLSDDSQSEDSAVPAMRRAVAVCCQYSASPSTMISSFEMELFRLCLHSLPSHERPAQFAAFQHLLARQPRFLLEYLDDAIEEGDKRRVRNALRHKALDESTTPLDDNALRKLVLLDVKDKNVHGLVRILRHRTKRDPLNRSSWELLGKLEVYFGARESFRAEEFAAALAKTGGVDFYSRPRVSSDSQSLTSLTEWRPSAMSISQIPHIVSLGMSLQVLDLSYNLLVSLPSAVCGLTRLRQLNLTGNSLVSLPTTIGQLTQLKTIAVAHNNLTEIPNAFWDSLVRLRDVDLRYNALPSLSPRVLRLVQLQSIRVVGNSFAWKDFQHIAAKLPSGTTVDIRPVVSVPSGVEPTAAAKNLEKIAKNPEPTTDEAQDVANQDNVMSEKIEQHSSGGEDGVIDLSESKDDEKMKTQDVDPVEVVDVEMADTPSSSTLCGDIPTAAEPSSAQKNRHDGSKTPSESSESDDDVQFLGSSPSKTLPISIPRAAVSIDSAQATSPAASTHASSTTASPLRAAQPLPVDRSSTAWRTAMASLLNHTPGLLRKCSQCFAEDPSGTHQRLNGLTLCALCLQDALSLVLEQYTTASSKSTASP